MNQKEIVKNPDFEFLFDRSVVHRKLVDAAGTVRTATHRVGVVYINDPEFKGVGIACEFDEASLLVAFTVQAPIADTDGPVFFEATRPITARLMRALPFASIVRACAAATYFDPDGDGIQPLSDAGFGAFDFGGFEFGKRPGQRGRPDLHYAAMAAQYVAAIATGSARPIEDVAALTGLSAKQVSNTVSQARQRGLLTGGGRGRAGGQLTPKAHELLTATVKVSEPLPSVPGPSKRRRK